ncbi:MAG TPA: hypothetical protein VN873_16485 [Candidatus Angelobacter sp.]|nr:hypothetical protein [Candidatus Angelobacter sp.]
MNPEQKFQWIKWLTWPFIFGLFVSGATAIPLQRELDLAVKLLGPPDLLHQASSTGLRFWIWKVHEGLAAAYAAFPSLAYGTDWLAFGHFVIAIAFFGALRDPVRNRWLYQFGMIACVLVIPYAMIMGAMRGIPFYWRLIDCSFGVFGIVPLWFCWKWTGELEKANERRPKPFTKPSLKRHSTRTRNAIR